VAQSGKSTKGFGEEHRRFDKRGLRCAELLTIPIKTRPGSHREFEDLKIQQIHLLFFCIALIEGLFLGAQGILRHLDVLPYGDAEFPSQHSKIRLCFWTKWSSAKCADCRGKLFNPGVG
jgi:hypothetical protein